MVAALILGALVAPSGVALTRRLRRPLVAAGACTLSAGLVAMGGSIPVAAMAVVAVVGLEVLTSPAAPILRNVLHDHTGSETRATLLSVVSLVSMGGAFIGSLVFPFVVERTSLSVGLFLAGLTAAVAAFPLLIGTSDSAPAEGARRFDAPTPAGAIRQS
jgi:sugar phosphate permease